MKLSLTLIFLFLISCATPKFPGKIVSPEKDKIHFCVVGDVGNGSATQMHVAQAMRESGCERLILLGDLIYPHGVSSARDPEIEERFLHPYRSFSKVYIVLGNHDYEGNAGAWKEIAFADPRIIHPESFFKDKIGDACLFFLDSNFQADKSLHRKEGDWVEKERKGCTYSAAFSHHPYKSSGLSHGHARNELKQFFEKHIVGKFDVIFSGHDHILRDEGEFKQTRQIVSGAGGKYDSGERPGFTLFTLDLKDPKKSTYQLIKI